MGGEGGGGGGSSVVKSGGVQSLPPAANMQEGKVGESFT